MQRVWIPQRGGMTTCSNVIYRVNYPISAQQFADLLQETSLGERRPLDDTDRLQRMLQHANLTVTAWQDERLVGIARSLTDFTFCCYLSDLAVAGTVQKGGIGKRLIAEICYQLEASCHVILLAAPLAEAYYPKIAFQQHRSAWTIRADEFIRENQ
jgi:predicted N-acetyltransferase YhbS